jgi:cytosine/adenosine deaminase-related metal-dependent hydrolase
VLRSGLPIAIVVGVALAPSAFSACGDNPTRPLPKFDGGGPQDTATTNASKDVIVLAGTIVTPDKTIDGEILVADGHIACVAEGQGCRDRPEALRATILETDGVIAPGLIDTHNHILFDIFDDSDWLPSKTYLNHDQWTNEARYKAMLDVKQCLANDSQGKPPWCDATPYGTRDGNLRCELDKWGELKGLIAGTTSIVGLPGTAAPCFGSLARSMGLPQNGFDDDTIRTSGLFPPSNPDGVCADFADKSASAYLIHCGEGIDARSLAEFAKLGSVTTTPECLYAPQTAITHGTAFTQTEFATMAAKGMKLTWSPASNVALYGATTNIPLALDAGVKVAIAPDWSMGGSQNLLDELRFARDWDQQHWNGRLSPQDLVTMTTAIPASILAFEDKIGAIKEGYVADIAVFAGDRKKPYDAIVAATPKDVRLVLIGGVPLYGDQDFKNVAPDAPGCEEIDICGASKFLCVATDQSQDKLGQTYAEIKGALEKALVDVDEATPSDGFSFAPLAPIVKCAK